MIVTLRWRKRNSMQRLFPIAWIIPFVETLVNSVNSSPSKTKGKSDLKESSIFPIAWIGTHVEIIRINTRPAGSILFVNPVNQSRSPLVSLRLPRRSWREAFLIGSPSSLITSTAFCTPCVDAILFVLMKFTWPMQTIRVYVRPFFARFQWNRLSRITRFVSLFPEFLALDQSERRRDWLAKGIAFLKSQMNFETLSVRCVLFVKRIIDYVNGSQ